ncbi:MAG: hypothetical protein IJY71_07615 [Clostridia bacterium]|nr:hypothetical protein [Clostridia bacterium]
MKKRKKEPLGVQIAEKSRLLRVDELSTLLFHLAYPVFTGEGSEKRNKETEALLAAIEEGCRALSLRIAKEYKENPREDKRFTHRPYRVTLSVEEKREGERLSLFFTLSVSHRGRLLQEETLARHLSLRDGKALFPPLGVPRLKKALDFFTKKRYNRRVKQQKERKRV